MNIFTRIIAGGCACALVLGTFSSCRKYESGVGPIVTGGLKKPNEVSQTAHTQQFVNAKISIDQAMQSPEARADRGASIVQAIDDWAPRGR